MIIIKAKISHKIFSRRSGVRPALAAGFTLIELIVSVAIFSVIMLTATQIFQMVINSQRSSLATQNVQESLRYFLEVIGKEIRMAQKNDGTCPGIPTTEIFVVGTDGQGNSTLNFLNYYGQCVTYYLAPDPTTSTTERFEISRVTNGITQADFISPAQITIDHLKFILNESSSTQPIITANLQAHALNEGKYQSTMTIQTSWVSRYYK